MRSPDNKADQTDKDTKQIILDATVNLIREDGFQCATLRNIAARAETNLALVNYYYRSKENLLGDAVRVLVSTFDDAFKALEDESMPPKERLKFFFIRYIGHLQKYPGLAMAMMSQGPQIMGSLDGYDRYCKMMRQQKMLAALQEITGEANEKKLMLMLLQLYGAIVLPTFMISCSPDESSRPAPLSNLPSLDEQIDGLFQQFFYQYSI